MARNPSEETPHLDPGEAGVTGGNFVLVGVEDIADGDPGEDADLALGSDVHDVEELERQLKASDLDAMLRSYLADEPTPAVPPLPSLQRRK